MFLSLIVPTLTALLLTQAPATTCHTPAEMSTTLRGEGARQVRTFVGEAAAGVNFFTGENADEVHVWVRGPATIVISFRAGCAIGLRSMATPPHLREGSKP